jgi:regulator of protease activity HflC (stomatin/prohibitin superfamily)
MGYERNTQMKVVAWGLFFLIALPSLYYMFAWDVVPQNTVGIKYSTWSDSPDLNKLYPNGRHYIGFWAAFHKYPISVQEFSFTYGGEEDRGREKSEGEFGLVTVRTVDGLELQVKLFIQYYINVEQLVQLYDKYTTNQGHRDALFSIFRATVNDVISDFSSVRIYEERSVMETELTEEITRQGVDQFYIIHRVGMRSIDFPDEFEQAQLDKRTAEAQVEEAIQEQAEAVVRAQTQVLEASAEAERKVIQATADAEALLIQANAEAEATQAVKEALEMTNAEYNQYLYIRMLEETEGDMILIAGETPPDLILPVKQPME